MREETSTQASRISDALRRRPLASAAGMFMLGIFAHDVLPVWPAGYLLLMVPLMAALLWSRLRRPILGAMVLGGSIFLAGLAAGQIEAFYYPPDHISQFTADEPRLVRLDMRIDTPPRVLAQTGPIPLPPREVMQARLLRVETDEGWKEASGEIMVQIQEPHPTLGIRDRVIVRGMMGRPVAAANPGQFDWSAYYRDQRILASLHVPYAANVQVVESPGPNLLDRLRRQVRQLLQKGFSKNHSLDHALLRALVVGDPDPELRDVQAEFVRTGTSHHLAISGMHVAVLGFVVFGICRLLRLGPRLATWIGLVFVILYGLVALPSPPVVRSILLCCAFALGILWRRSVDGVQLLTLSVLAMLIYHPLDLYNAGFQLSFGTVLGLMTLSRPALRFADSLRDRDMVIAMQMQRPRGWRALRQWLRRWAIDVLATGGVATLVAAPLVAFHFNQLNPWAILASIILALPVFLALVGGFFKVIVTLLCPMLAPAAATVAGWPVGLMRTWVVWLGKLPGSNLPLARPPLWLLLIYYALLLLPLAPWKIGRWRWALRAAPAAGVLVLVSSLLWRAVFGGGVDGRLRLAVLSIGSGQCAAVHLPSGRTVLFDAGSDSIADVARNCLIPYLRQAGSTRVQRVFISHANQDHFNAVAETARQFSPDEICVNGLFARQSRSSEPGRELLDALDEQHRPLRPLRAGERVNLEAGVAVEVLWPPGGADLDANESSLVLKLTCNGRAILFTGDIQQAAEESLLSDPAKLKADVLIAPHHGSSEPTTERFLAAVDPAVVICSNDRTLTRKQRNFDQLAAQRAVYRTSECGAVMVDIGAGGGIGVTTFCRRADAGR